MQDDITNIIYGEGSKRRNLTNPGASREILQCHSPPSQGLEGIIPEVPRDYVSDDPPPVHEHRMLVHLCDCVPHSVKVDLTNRSRPPLRTLEHCVTQNSVANCQGNHRLSVGVAQRPTERDATAQRVGCTDNRLGSRNSYPDTPDSYGEGDLPETSAIHIDQDVPELPP